MLNILLLVANAVGLFLLFLKGERPERIAAMLVLLTVLAEPFVQNYQIGNWRIGIVLVNGALLAGLWILSEIANRWWLVFATALQLVLVLSALMPLMTREFIVDTGVAVRLALWAVIILVLFMGVWEASAARRFAREARPR